MLLTIGQKNQLENLDIQGRWEEYKDYKYNVQVWKKFWQKQYHGKQSDSVLDFGSGACWCSFIAKSQGYISIKNLDIDTADARQIFGKYATILGQEVNYYDGKVIPFQDRSFDSIIAKASILKLERTEFVILIEELIRVSKANATWYIASKGMCRKFISSISENKFLNQKLLDQKIRIQPWTWKPFEFNRSKSPFTEFEVLYILRKLATNISQRVKAFLVDFKS